MKKLWGKAFVLMVMIGAVGGMTGCSHMIKPPGDDVGARHLLERLSQHNSTLTQFKGLADIRMRVNGKSHSGRIAFAAIRPDKMRIELLNMMGTPLTSLSGDGDTISILSHGDQKHYRFRQTRTALASLINIPIGIEDLQTVLAGGVPLPPHASAQWHSTGPDAQETRIIIKNRWHDVVAKLDVDQEQKQARTMQVMSPEGEVLYTIQWLKWRRVNAYRIPLKLIITSPAKQKLTLTMDRYWPNAKVAPSTFALEISKNDT